jgi:hypothetical protein
MLCSLSLAVEGVIFRKEVAQCMQCFRNGVHMRRKLHVSNSAKMVTGNVEDVFLSLCDIDRYIFIRK